MNQSTALSGKTIAILVTDGFEQIELTAPKHALEAAGAKTRIIAPKSGEIQGFHHVDKGDRFTVDQPLGEASPDGFDAVLLPGGVHNADALRTEEQAQAFVKRIAQQGKPIAVICHGAWLLVDSDLVRGRTLTSWPSLQADLRNAGATWVDEPVRVDGQFVSSRKPDDIPAFNAGFIQLLAA